MEPTKELVVALFRDKVEMAKRMSVAERFESGFTLFDAASETTRSGIRHQFPEAGPDEVERIFRERLKLAERLHDRGIFKPFEADS